MRFLAVEYALPSLKVSNADVKAQVRQASAPHLDDAELSALETMMDGVFDACGTELRYHRAPGERAGDLTVDAAQRALANSGLAPEDIDLVLYVGIGRGFLEPSSGTLYTDILGLTNATTFDVLDACASWLRALHLAKTFFMAGTYRNILVINSEFEGIEAHRWEIKDLREFEHWHPGITIGEAATATVLTASETEVMGTGEDTFDVSWRTTGHNRSLCYIPLKNYSEYHFDIETAPRSQRRGGWQAIPNMQFVSYGMQLMDAGAQQIVQHYRDEPGYKDFDPEIIFTHAASDGVARRTAEELGINLDRLQQHHRNYANIVSASVPVAMATAIEAGELKSGMRTQINVASAGVTTGLANLTYLN